jgi:hypothetical protein
MAKARDTGVLHTVWPPRRRAERYRAHAARFRKLAEGETRPGFRARLLDLARQYDRLADHLAAKEGN